MKTPSPWQTFSTSTSNCFSLTVPRRRTFRCSASKARYCAKVALTGSVSRQCTGADFVRKYWARIAETKLLPTPPFPCSTRCTDAAGPIPLTSSFVIQLPFIDQIKSSLLADGSYSNLDSFAFSRCSRRFLKGSESGGAGDAFSSLVRGGGCPRSD